MRRLCDEDDSGDELGATVKQFSLCELVGSFEFPGVDEYDRRDLPRNKSRNRRRAEEVSTEAVDNCLRSRSAKFYE